MITIVAGARPNFMKIAPIIRSIQEKKDLHPGLSYRLVHTGQHYDSAMSSDFFDQLEIPQPDVNLFCNTGSQAEITASVMLKFEAELRNNFPKLVLVVGDVTSTMACTITAKKMKIDTVHVEAGIRSGDMTMPEEINRIVTDAICDHYFTTSEMAGDNLLHAGIKKERIHFVGNTMIDTLIFNINKIKKPYFLEKSNLGSKKYYLLTLHRPSNVDDPNKLSYLLSHILKSAKDIPVVFPVHPRTLHILKQHKIPVSSFILVDPQPYLEFMYLVKNAMGIITDSGGITEEATVLKIPCLTLRTSTERPETIFIGSNELVGEDMDLLDRKMCDMKKGKWKDSTIPELWDGKSSKRIIDIIHSLYYSN